MGLNVNDIENEIDLDQLEDQGHYDGPSGNFSFKLLPIGKHPARLIEYIEYGVQPQRAFDGKDRPDCEQVALTFEFLGKRTVETKEDGSGEFAPRKTIYLKKSFHEKAGYRKLFEKMRAGDTTIKNMSQMVGKGEWLIGVEWTTKDADGKRITIPASKAAEYEKRLEDAKGDDKKKFAIYDNIKNSEGFLVHAAQRALIDEDTGEETGEFAKVPVRANIGELRVFIWDQPKPLFWDSIFIDGEYTREVDGKEQTFSKNRHQEKIMAAKNFAGSAIEAMLGGVDNLPGMVDNGDVVDDKDEGPSDEGKPAKKQDAPAAETNKDDAPSPSEEVDECDELGI